jgi:hypothetical protein
VGHRDELGVEPQPVAEARGHRQCEPIVAAVDAVHLARLVGSRELIDERDERQLVGIGQEESAQADGRHAQFLVRLPIVEPLRDRLPRQVGGDRRIPALVGEAVAPGQIAQLTGQAVPSARRFALDDPCAAGRVGPDVPESGPENLGQA